MAYPVYVLLPEDVAWTPVPGTTAQSPTTVRWYLRRQMPDAATQMGVLVEGEGDELTGRLVAVAARAAELGGIAIDASTQEPVDTATLVSDTP